MTLSHLRRLISRLTPHISYANVVATIALFLSLGGVSYATLVLPPHSVGAPQLQSGAVVSRALGVALGAGARVRQRTYEIDGSCGVGSTGGVAPCRSRPPTTLAVTRVNTASPGLLLVSALAGMAETGRSDDPAEVALTARVDGVALPGELPGLIGAGVTTQVPYQSSVHVEAGEHRVVLKISATGFTGQLRVRPVSLNAVVLPPAS